MYFTMHIGSVHFYSKMKLDLPSDAENGDDGVYLAVNINVLSFFYHNSFYLDSSEHCILHI